MIVQWPKITILTFGSPIDATVDSQKFVYIVNFANIQKIDFWIFQLCELGPTRSASFTLKSGSTNHWEF